MMKRACLVIALFAAACGGTTTETATSGGGGNSGSTTGGPGPSTGPGSPASSGSGGSLQGYTVTYDPFTLMPGKEDTQCVVKKLPNTMPFHAGTIHNTLSVGSHHMIVYKTNDTVEQPTPFACQPFSDLLHPEKGTPLMITQKEDDVLTLPQGVGYPIGTDQFIRLELHYINSTGAPLTVSASSTFVPMNEADHTADADFAFFGNPDISIPAHSKFTLGPTYLPLPTQLDGVSFFGFTGHEHKLGTNVTVATAPSKTGADTSVYDVPNWKWNEPPTVYPNPPVVVPQSGGFHFTCDWDNTTASTVGFGESANNEMCFFWTYYYPSKGALVCFHSDQVPGGINLCCPGSPICDMLFP